jgi:DNA polymerase III epsilon subunit-like protein
MKYVSIDIETSGLNPEKCEILSIGAVIEDTNNLVPLEDLPRFHVAIIGREGIYGELFALNMNKDLIESIVQYQRAKDQDEKNNLIMLTGMKFLKAEEVIKEFYHWLFANGVFEINRFPINHYIENHPEYGTVPITNGNNVTRAYLNVAGKNFGTFDKIFLEKLPRWNQLIKVRSRILDPAILCVDWISDESLPGLDLCKKRASIEGKVTHNALEDAIDVVAVLRTKYKL